MIKLKNTEVISLLNEKKIEITSTPVLVGISDPKIGKSGKPSVALLFVARSGSSTKASELFWGNVPLVRHLQGAFSEALEKVDKTLLKVGASWDGWSIGIEEGTEPFYDDQTPMSNGSENLVSSTTGEAIYRLTTLVGPGEEFENVVVAKVVESKFAGARTEVKELSLS